MKVLLKLNIICLIIILDIIVIINCLFVSNVTKTNYNKKTAKIPTSATLWTDPYDEEYGVWSKVLEEYTLNFSKTNRMSRMEGPHRYIPTSDFYITRRVDEMELDVNKRLPSIASLQSSGNYQNIGNLNMNSGSFSSQSPPPLHQLNNNQMSNNNFQNSHPLPMNRQIFPPNQRLREVTETDLYLLGAIEKLVYRVDYLENRIRRSEQLIYYLTAGHNEHKKESIADPCPKNFTRIGDNCYHIAGDRQLNWKLANSFCKSMNSHLAEFTTITENEEIVAFLLNHPGHRAKDFWLGGLNPGLLWIWSNSAKPINPNTDLSTLTNNSTHNNNSQTNENKILHNTTEIKGSGRCLRLSYNPAKHSYYYYGQECTSRGHFICEFEDNTLENQIKKVGRSLNLF